MNGGEVNKSEVSLPLSLVNLATTIRVFPPQVGATPNNSGKSTGVAQLQRGCVGVDVAVVHEVHGGSHKIKNGGIRQSSSVVEDENFAAIPRLPPLQEATLLCQRLG